MAAPAVILAMVTGGYVAFDGDGAPVRAAASRAVAESQPPTTTSSPLRTATLAFGGDILIHSGVWRAAAVAGDHDFSPMLAPIAPRLSSADLAICHLEGTLARPGEELSGYPRFRAPTHLATDLAEAGFDGCSLASNHALDYGEDGVRATLDAFDAAGLARTGTARLAEGRQPAVYDADGIRVAHLSYTDGFNGLERPAGKDWMIDRIDPPRILADARAAREAGAELVVVSLDWGDEYVNEVTAEQQRVADALAADAGAIDLVVGHHAHVVQPISKVGSMWVVWGMGNLLSDSSPQCCTTEATDGVVVTVTIGNTEPGGPVGVTGMEFTPTWNERDAYRVLPAEAELAAQNDAWLTDALKASLDRTTAHVLSMGGAELGITRSP